VSHTEDLIRKIIREELLREKAVSLQNGKKAEYGSARHLKDLQKKFETLKHVRDSAPRRSADRYSYSRALERLRQELRRVERFMKKKEAAQEAALSLNESVEAHIMNLYEDLDMPIQELYVLIQDALDGNLEEVQEKMDGQSYTFTVIGGELRVLGKGATARSVERGGLSREGISEKYDHLPGIKNAFLGAYDAISASLSEFGNENVQALFQDGKVVIMTEVLTPLSPNTIMYDKNHVRFIRAQEVVDGIEVDKALYGKFIKLVDKIVDQEGREWSMGEVPVLKAAEAVKNDDVIKELKSQLDNLVSQMGMTKKNTIGDLNVALVKSGLEKYDFIPDKLREAAAIRFATGSKKALTKKDYLNAASIDDWREFQNLEKRRPYVVAEMIIPLERIIQRLGAYVIRNLEFVLASNDTAKGADLLQFVSSVKNALQQGHVIADPVVLEKVRVELERIGNNADLFEKAVEGIVFRRNGKLYKLTGMFTPIHRLRSLFHYKQGKREPARLSENVIHHPQHLHEGGNIFKDNEGDVLTKGVKRESVDPTLEHLFNNVLMDILDDLAGTPAVQARYEKLGSTGKREVSGDLDIAIFSPSDDPKIAKQYKNNLATSLKRVLGDENVKLAGQNVHVMYPIIGDEGYAQIDIMLGSNLKSMAWYMAGSGDTGVRGIYRNLLLAFVAKKRSQEKSETVGRDIKISLGFPSGIQVKADGKEIRKRTNNPDIILRLLGIQAKQDEVATFESLTDVLKNSSFRAALPEFKDYISHMIKADPDGYNKAIRYIETTLGESLLRTTIKAISDNNDNRDSWKVLPIFKG